MVPFNQKVFPRLGLKPTSRGVLKDRLEQRQASAPIPRIRTNVHIKGWGAPKDWSKLA